MRAVVPLVVLFAGACASADPPSPPQVPGVPEIAYEPQDLDVPPRPTNARVLANAIARSYPMHLRRDRVSGRVVLRFRVDTRGIPGEIHVVRGSHVEFERPAMDAVRLLRFRPGMRGGQPVHVWITQPIEWTVHRD